MVGMAPFINVFVTALLLGQTIAHPGHSVDHEIAERAAYLRHAKRDLSHCQSKLAARGIEARAVERRSAAVKGLRSAVKSRKAEEHKATQRKGKHNEQGKHGGKSHKSKTTSTHSPTKYTSTSGFTTSVSGSTTKHSASSASSSKVSATSSNKVSAIVTSSSKALSTLSSSLNYSSGIVIGSASSSVSSSIKISAIASSSGSSSTKVSSSVVSGTASASGSTGSASASGGPSGSGAMPSGAMPSGTENGTSSTNTTDGAGQTASSISTFGQEVADTSHLSNLTVTPSTSDVEDIIFGNRSCVLNPEGEAGPFYVTGEFIRTDIAESQAGIPTYIDGQFIDVSTCEPIVDLYWDLWHANSTGVYGGVIGNGNGNSADTSNLNNTFLRGLQPTDSDGVAQFQSIFPGHYAGRATHIHVITHIGGSVLSNGTYEGGDITHVGQLFFDQDLITDVNAISPYSTNTIAVVDNDNDRVFAEETLSDSDPVFDYVLLGDDVSDGIFAWVSIGVDTSAAYTASTAAAYGEDGGVLE